MTLSQINKIELTNPSSSNQILNLVTKEKVIPIEIGNNIVFQKSFIDKVLSISKNIVILTDTNVNELYGEKLKSSFEEQKTYPLFISILPGESQKNRETKSFIEDLMLKNNLTKDTLIIALGGGVICDLAAFVASTYYRGIFLVMVPTTLLAQVDAAIGGKSAVNTSFGKNLIGNFYHPEQTFIDTIFLKSLPNNELLNGLSEIIKYSLIFSSSLFDELYQGKDHLDLEKIILRCCEMKINIVKLDEKEKSLRSILNFGHTLGHCIEQIEEYKISHGEAIAIGMIFASYLSVKEKLLDTKEFLKIFSIFKIYGFPLIFSQAVTLKKLLDHLLYDKKAKDKTPRFVLLEEIGKVKAEKEIYLHEIDKEKLRHALIWLYKRFIDKREK